MKDFIFQNPNLIEQRRSNRNNPTKAEQLLWERIRKKQLYGFRFLRQYSVGPYILDFYCPKMHLGIEVDGGYHKTNNQKRYDMEKEKFIKSTGINVIRFDNEEVLNKIGVVINKITEYLLQ
ncbi:MAG: endonuclease domain-containing protein [Ignavibacteriae bacterium]|nr:endonuclease domain-containing protein [Ignavibacteriota bacterium]